MLRYTPKRIDLLAILCLFILTHFIYTDFLIRHIYSLLFIIFAAFLNLILNKGKLRFSLSSILFLYLGVIVSIYLLLPGSRKDADTANFAIVIIVMGLMIMSENSSQEDIQRAFTLIKIGATLISLYVIYCRINPSFYLNYVLPHLSEEVKIRGATLLENGYGVPLGGSSVFADYVFSLCLFVVFSDMLVNKWNRKETIANGALICVIVAGLLAEGRRGEPLAAMCALIIQAVFTLNFLSRKESRKFLKLLIVSIVLLCILLYALYTLDFLSRFVVTFERIQANKRGSSIDITSGRATLWKLAISLFLTEPLTGIGWGNYALYAPVIAGADIAEAHNTCLQILCETGIIGFVLIIVPILMMFLATLGLLRKLSHGKSKKFNRIVCSISCSIQAFFIVLGMIDPSFYKIMHWAMYAVAICFYNFAKRQRVMTSVMQEENMMGQKALINRLVSAGGGGRENKLPRTAYAIKRTYKSQKITLRNVPMIIMGIIYAFFFLIADFSINVTTFVIVTTIILACVAFFATLQNPRFKSSKIQTAFVFLTLIICVNIHPLYLKTPFYLYSLIVFCFFLGFIQYGMRERLFILRILLISSTVVSAIVLMSRFLPDSYAVILEIISPESNAYSRRVMNAGYSGAVGQEIGVTAQYVLVGIPILLGRYYAYRNKGYLVAIAVWFCFVVMVGRRTELIASALAFFVVSYFVAKSNKKKLYLLMSCFFLFFFIALCTLISMDVITTYDGDNRIIDSLFLALHGVDITNGRSALYKLAVRLFLEHPWFGIGWGAFRLYSTSVLPNVINVHNVYLQLLCEIGIVGFVFFCAGWAFIIRFVYRTFKKHRYDPYCEITTFPMFMCIYILVNGLLDNTVYYNHFWQLMSVIIFCSFRFDDIGQKTVRKTPLASFIPYQNKIIRFQEADYDGKESHIF